MPKLNVEVVIWQDAEIIGDIKTTREVNSHSMMLTISVGCLVEEADKYVTLALENYVDEDSHRTMVVIPKSLVVWRKSIAVNYPSDLEY